MKTVHLVDVPLYQTGIEHVCMDVEYHLCVWMLLKKGACKLVRTHQIVNAPGCQQEPEDHLCEIQKFRRTSV